jgi:hAT family C-terminal dimerisation region
MYQATILLSSSSSPTQGDLRLTFLGMFASLQHYQEQSNQNDITNAIYNKLKTYWDRHLSNSSSISAILDPRYKLTTFNNLEERNDYINHLKTLFSSYMTNSSAIPSRVNLNTSQNSRNYFLNMINNNQVYSSMENPEFNEIDNYLNTPNDINNDPLIWWKAHQKEYPILSLIARDYLIIQSTSVSSEQAFSVAGNTITQTRNRLDPETARASLCLKSWIENGLGLNIINEIHEETNLSDSDYVYNSSNSESDSSSDGNSYDSDSESI